MGSCHHLIRLTFSSCTYNNALFTVSVLLLNLVHNSIDLPLLLSIMVNSYLVVRVQQRNL